MDRQPLTPGAAHLIGLLLIAAGILPMLAAFDLGPLRQEDINGPPWLGFVAGGIFAAGGAALIAGPQAPLASGLCGILAAAGLAAIGNWIAFGAGQRACTGSISLPWLWTGADLSGLACRLPFGFGALIVDAVVCYATVALLQKALGGPPRLARLLKATEWLIIASLAPLILLLLLMTVGSGLASAVRSRWKTGAWPRNEEFIARQKARGMLGRLGGKAAPGDDRKPGDPGLTR